MAVLKVVVLLAVVAIGSSSFALPFSNDALSRMRRQLPSAQCQTDFLTMTSNACFSMFGEGTVITKEDAKQFCADGCDVTLTGLFKKILADCGDFASGIDQSQLVVLEHACLKDGVKHSDGKSHTCLEDIADVQGTTSPPQYFTDCQDSFQRNHQCTDACKESIDYITKHFGCCYYDMAKAGMNATSPDVWNACKVSYPKQC